MSTKTKRVTYNEPVDDTADYLEPLQYDPNPTVTIRPRSAKKPPRPGGVFGSIYLPITLLLYVGVPISQFVIGIIYINQCTVRQFIPVYMILSGICGIVFVIIGLIVYKKMSSQSSSLPYDDSRPNQMVLKILIPIFVLLLLSVIGWFFAGQALVFEVKLRVEFFDPVLPEYCHGHLYKAAYILIFVDYIIFLIAIILNILSCMAPPDENIHQKKRPTRSTRK
jgi:hypothetical protein